jgi:hypothetical protein
MGATISTPAKSTPNANASQNVGIFKKEMENLESLVNSIITPNNTFKDSDYNFMNKSVCDKYTMVLGSKLSKHLKIHLQDIVSDVYFVPKHEDSIPLKNEQKVTKSELCSLITNHYTKTLRILSMVRTIYDFENGGNYSIAGIVYRNLKQTNGMYEVSYCGVKQEPLSDNSKVDFANLKGLDMFVNEFLTEEEAEVFLNHLKGLFGNYKKRNIEKTVCKDTLIDLDTYKAIYDDITFQCAKSGGGKPIRKKKSLLIAVNENNPIISYELCFDKRKIAVPLSKRVGDLFKTFKDNYVKNVDSIKNTIHKLVQSDYKETPTLRDLSHSQLHAIEVEVKRSIILMYVQSMVDYYKILSHVKTIA